MAGWFKQTLPLRVAVRDCQTQTLSPADLQLALMQAAENGNNHQREPEASVTTDVREGKKDQTLPNSTDTNKDRQEGEKPLHSTSASGTGQIPGERQRKIEGQGEILPKSQSQIEGQADLELAAGNAYNHQKEPEASVMYEWKGNGDQPWLNSTDTYKDSQEGEKPLNSASASGTGQVLGKRQQKIERQGENPGKDPNAPDDPNANVKKVAKYAFGVAAIGVGIFVVAPILLRCTLAVPSINIGLNFGGPAVITGLNACLGAVRYITRPKNRRPTKDADTQTDLNKSD